MKKYRINFLLLLILSFFFFGCDSNDNNESLEPIDGKIFITVEEDFSSYEAIEEPKLYIKLRTEKVYPCFNYSIASDVKISGDRVLLNLYGIARPGICLTAFGPAHGIQRLEIPNSNFIFEIKANNLTDLYHLSVNEQIISLKEIDNIFTIDSLKTFYRTPENSFMLFYSPVYTIDSSDILNQLIDTIKSQVNLIEFTFPDSVNFIYKKYVGNSETRIAKYFTYQKEEDYNKIIDICDSFTQNHWSEYRIDLINFKNKKAYFQPSLSTNLN